MKQVLLIALFTLSSWLPGGALAEPVSRLIVQFSEPSPVSGRRLPSAAQFDLLRRAAGTPLQHRRQLAGGAQLMELPAALDRAAAEALARRISAEPGVEFAHPDYRRRIASHITPSDADFFRQWYLMTPSGSNEGAIDAQSAWHTVTGETGIPPVVAVLDSGIRPHPELAGRLADDGDGPSGYDFISLDPSGDPATANDGDGRDADPGDPGDWLPASVINALPEVFDGCPVSRESSWHGTAVAGIVGASADTSVNGEGTVGIHHNVRILPVRVLGRCGGYISDIADAIRWAAGLPISGVPTNNAPAQVINLSFGAPGDCSAIEQAAIDAALRQGALVVAAAGNEGNSNPAPDPTPGVDNHYEASDSAPGNCQRVLTVAATTREGGRAAYTNYNERDDAVKLAAPGGESTPEDGIYAPVDSGRTAPVGDGFVYLAGTSFSTPMVSGAAALLLSLNNRLSPSCLYDDLLASARPFPAVAGTPCTTATCGAGILDVNRAVARVDARGPGGCGSETLVPGSGGSTSGSSGSAWGLLGLLLLGVFSRRRAATWRRRCRSR